MASMSKRTQARNERELHELARLPGNSQCADCGAKAPAWASWNLGIFLCMRCASLHRKLGTHISKVKSLSMDTWTTDQVENMKRNGNIAANKIYNPKNKKPDIPLDADEADSAMERFIRKKYQEKSLLDGKPEPPRHDDASPPTYSRPQEDDSPPPPLPPKKGKLFGFSLRTSSSAYPLSKHDKKKLPREPHEDPTFHIANDDYNTMSRMADARFEMTDAELQKKLTALRDMGFTDTERNTNLLRRLNGNVERTIETLVQFGSTESGNPYTSRKPDQNPSAGLTRSSANASTPAAGASKSPEPSYNPFTQMTNQQTIGLSMTKPPEPSGSSTQLYSSNNPFGPGTRNQTESGLEQSMQSMQLAQPLFPHSTGGYPSQPPSLRDPRLQYSMTPPALSTQFQRGYVASPAAISVNTNPFFQPAPASAQSTGNNPFLPQEAPAPAPVPSSPSTNPFLNYHSTPGGQPAQIPRKQSSLPANFNPFGIPPSQSPPQTTQPQLQPHPRDLFDTAQQPPFMNQQPSNPFLAQGNQTQQPPQQQFPSSQLPQSPPTFPKFHYGQTQAQPQAQPSQFQPQSTFQQQINPQAQALIPQQTGRYDKNSIMALYNYPQLASRPLASIPEPGAESTGQQQISPARSGDIFGELNPVGGAKRSATMPVSLSHMHSAGGTGNRNPFLTNTASANTNAIVNPTPNAGGFPGDMATPPRPQGQPQGIVARHASAESVSINNLEGGRHSPDAFANLSARLAQTNYMRNYEAEYRRVFLQALDSLVPIRNSDLAEYTQRSIPFLRDQR
ncbi:uncharacterized protein Z518_10453 [Rhinocladiella mackenziei CBS 650.93]|uniref:Arf-GAP domain-containing protein n=1 Tax=Rhinocladiella mackenziei CBS 650.93 TaxID=1442369 RepID=A0A0D2I3G5_9EURO|nr:uncharacterized protein Z518_10453 [Rhinocladiella mackenziei CBS 650.93]KIX00314.1 hypothetical protein Z518_10453 [Rhinocladiella mackenziei CBS 650.93]